VQTHKFFIKVLVRNESVLNVWTSNFEDIGYNLKKNGWLNNFTNVKNQSMWDDKFFSIFFSALTDKNNIILNWQCGVGSFFTSLFFMYVFLDNFNFFVFGQFPIHFFFVEAPSLLSSRTIPFNILVLDFQDIEAEQGKDSDRHGSPSFLLRLVRLEPPSHIYCFCLSLCKFIC
jgi:hypothetical protein